ncbi:hypothetical protein, partial [Rothia aeria]
IFYIPLNIREKRVLCEKVRKYHLFDPKPASRGLTPVRLTLVSSWVPERGIREGVGNIAECYERGAYTRNMTGCLCTCASYRVY